MAETNFIETQKALDQITESIDKQIQSASELNAKVIQLNTSYSKLPSEYVKKIKDLSDSYEKVVVSAKKTEEAENRLVATRTKNVAKTSEEIVNQGVLRRNADLQTKSTSNLVGAYANLSAQVAIASKRYQDIIARGQLATQTQKQYNRELKQAEIQFRTLQTRVLQADKAVDKWNRTGERSIGFARNLIGAFGIVGGATLLATVTTDIINTTKELQGLNNALMLVTDTQENFYEQQLFLSKIAEDFGLEIMGLTKQFTQFYVSAKDKISGNEIQEIFRSVSKAGASMGLSVQQQERAFLALNQMMSKGTVQAEELRGQLGEALPGAFGIMAKAVGVTEKELGNMMKAGDLLASDVLPKFARQLEKTYGIENINRIETMTTATNRLSNAWTGFIETIGASDGVISKTFTKILNFLSQSVQGFRLMTMTEAERSLERIGETVSKNVDGYKEYLATLDLTNAKVVEFEKNALQLGITRSQNARKEIDLLKEELKSLEGRGTVFEKQRNQIRDRIELLEIERQKYLQQVGAFNEVLNAKNKKTDTTKQLTNEEIKELDRLQKEKARLAEEDLQRLYQLQKMKLESEKRYFDELSKDTGMYYHEREEFALDSLSKEIELAELAREEGLRLAKGNRTQEMIVWEEFYRDFESIVKDSEARILQLRKDSYKEWEDHVTEFDGEGLKLNLFGDDPSAEFKKWREGNKEQLDLAKEDYIQFASDIANEANNLANALMDREIQKYDRQLEMSNSYYENLIKNAEQGTEQEILLQEAKEQAEERINERKRQALKRQAVLNKLMSIAQIGMSTAVAVMKNYEQGFAVGSALNILTIAMGALQTATVLATPIPQYKYGTDSHIGGNAIVGDGGKKEVMITPDGKISVTPDKPTLIKNMPKGTEVIPSIPDFYKRMNLNPLSLNFTKLDNLPDVLEKSIEKGFKKAKINNYIKVPNLDIEHLIYKQKGL